MKGKKSQFYEIAFIVLTAIAYVSAFSVFFTLQRKADISFSSPQRILDLYEEKEKILFYAKESARLSSEQAFFEIAARGAVFDKRCMLCYEGYVRWEEQCKPDSRTEEKFIKRMKKHLDEHMKRYRYINYSVALERGKLLLKAEKTNLSTEEKEGFLRYKALHYFDPSFHLDMTFAFDFEDVYREAKNRWDICKKEEKREECMSVLRFENWKIKSVERKNNCTAITLETNKKFFFFDEEMKNQEILLRFGFE